MCGACSTCTHSCSHIMTSFYSRGELTFPGDSNTRSNVSNTKFGHGIPECIMVSFEANSLSKDSAVCHFAVEPRFINPQNTNQLFIKIKCYLSQTCEHHFVPTMWLMESWTTIVIHSGPVEFCVVMISKAPGLFPLSSLGYMARPFRS